MSDFESFVGLFDPSHYRSFLFLGVCKVLIRHQNIGEVLPVISNQTELVIAQIATVPVCRETSLLVVMGHS